MTDVRHDDLPPTKSKGRLELKLPQVMERADITNPGDSEGSGSSADDDQPPPAPLPRSNGGSSNGSHDGHEGDSARTKFSPTSTNNSVLTPMSSVASYGSWNPNTSGPPPTAPPQQQRPRGGSGTGARMGGLEVNTSTNGVGGTVGSATSSVTGQSRPIMSARTPSSTYAPARRPPQYISFGENRNRSMSATRSRRDPGAQYRAQEKAYVQRLTQDHPADYFPGPGAELYTPSVGYSTESELSDDESPSSEAAPVGDSDPYDQDGLLYYGDDDMRPSTEEIKIPANRERLEWHAMLAAVLTGDVVRQEKKRLIGATEQQGDASRKTELWTGIRAKVCGRTLAAQRRLLDDGRATLDPIIDAIVNFEIKGETEVGKPPREQVREVVHNIERCESLYPTRAALEEAKPKTSSDEYRSSCDAVIAWNNTTEHINTELDILRSWVGNDELDFRKPPRKHPSSTSTTTATTTTSPSPPSPPSLADDPSFLDRILKEDGLKCLQGDHNMLKGVNEVIRKAKETLIQNAEDFARRHLPPYIEELLTLINFPSRLIEEIIRMRLSFASRIKELQQNLLIEQMISQFQILLGLAIEIKQEYMEIAAPEPDWDLPPCVDDNFDPVVVDALKFYFKMLNWKLTGNRNTFKEAEILEQEWDFSNKIGRYLDGGDVEVAEQFSSLTSKALSRLATHFEKELQRKPNETPAEMDRRYIQNLDSVRVRQRKLFRFSRILGQRFENSTEYNINMDQESHQALFAALIESNHTLVHTAKAAARKGPNGSSEKESNDTILIVASPALHHRPKDVQSILGTCFHANDTLEDMSNPYVLMIRPEYPVYWDGRKLDIDIREPSGDLRPGRLRLVADGSQSRLANARLAFAQMTGMQLDVIIEQRANLSRVNAELMRIKKTAYKLSNTIMDSVEIIRKQTIGLECQDLIQTCFAFATEFGQRSLMFMDNNRRAMNNLKLTRLALDWISFVVDDCVATDRKTFKYAVAALEFAMLMTTGQNILSISDEEYARLRGKVAGCMSLLISHFDIMGARSTLAARMEKQRMEAMSGGFKKMDTSRMRNDDESSAYVREGWLAQLSEIEELRIARAAERHPLGRVLEDSNEADRSLTVLSSSATNVTLRWQQGQFVGGGTFGSVYAAINLDSGQLMAVKEIRLQDPQLIPSIAQQIRDEMGVLEVLDHPNIVSYFGIEVHRDKVYIFMEYCSGGSLAGLLEHGRIEDEQVISVYALQLLEGLAYLHERGIFHRDIKPENILLNHNGVIKYVDFGAAKIITRGTKTMAGDGPPANGPPGSGTRGGGRLKSMTGTPMYMSPEVIKGANAGRHGAMDVWSLGCVILEMATGRRPWANLDNEWAIMYNIAQGNPPQFPTRDQLSDAGLDFLRKCFDRDPAKRLSAAELLQTEWIMRIRSAANIESAGPSTPASDTS